MHSLSFDHIVDLARRFGGPHVYLLGFSALTTIGLFLLEALALGWEKSAARRVLVHPTRSAKLDLYIAGLDLLNLTPFLATVLSFGVGRYVPLWIDRTFGLNLVNLLPNVWARSVFYLLLFDFLFYWKHRFSHWAPWWWEIHEVHHSATELNIISADRLHPVDAALFRLLTCLPLAMAGAPPELYLYLRAVQVVHVKLTHSMLPWNFGWVGRYRLVSPVAHRVHHSDRPEHRDTNFGNLVPWWDKMFGTWREPVPGESYVTDDRPHYNHDAWYLDLWNAYLRFLRRLVPSGFFLPRHKAAPSRPLTP